MRASLQRNLLNILAIIYLKFATFKPYTIKLFCLNEYIFNGNVRKNGLRELR
jgi:hypothetical protein